MKITLQKDLLLIMIKQKYIFFKIIYIYNKQQKQWDI